MTMLSTIESAMSRPYSHYEEYYAVLEHCQPIERFRGKHQTLQIDDVVGEPREGSVIFYFYKRHAINYRTLPGHTGSLDRYRQGRVSISRSAYNSG